MTATLEREVALAPLELMLAELESNQLQVVLVPCRRACNEGGMVRVAASRNANWYRKFCAAHASSRKRSNAAFDTKIKRRDTIRLLERMIAGEDVKSVYAAELRKISESFS